VGPERMRTPPVFGCEMIEKSKQLHIDQKVETAITILNPDLQVLALDQFTTSNTVTIKVCKVSRGEKVVIVVCRGQNDINS